jgi:hypothetical protein
MRTLASACLVAIAIVMAIVLGNRARQWNDELALASPPLAAVPPQLDDPHTPRLTGRVVLVIVDGLGADEARLPFLDELREHGAGTTARVPYPTISRPNYVTILTGVPPRDSGVRANRVYVSVAVDTVMDRVQHAGLHVATASDYGVLPSLFVRHATSLAGIAWLEHDTHVTPPPPVTWPVDDARRVGSLGELAGTIAELAATDAAFIAVLVLDVDRAGHASGVGDTYRHAALAVDRMLRAGFTGIDLARDTVIVTADHGHVTPGGHGGDEPEVSNVPLVLAGKGIVPGAVAREARLIDVAPTIAALLGVPAPGHAEGRALVELLALAPDEAARRTVTDATRGRALATVVDAARARESTPDPIRLALALGGLGLAVALAFVLRRHSILAITPGSLAGALALVVMILVIVVITRGRVSPSYVPSLARTQELGSIGAGIAVVLQVVASWRVLRHATDRMATTNGIAFVGLAIAFGAIGLVRAWFSPPYFDVPPPFWMVMVPTLDLAAATCALATVVVLIVGAIRRT